MQLTGKERMMIALTGGTPDRVPAAPDISTMIPVRLSGKKFNEVEVDGTPPLWRAYINAAKQFGIDGWNVHASLAYQVKNSQVEGVSRVTRQEGCWRTDIDYKTPAGVLHQVVLSPDNNSGTPVEKPIKNFKEDFPKLKYLLQPPDSYDDSVYKEQKKEMGDMGLLCNTIGSPGLHVLFLYFEGGLEAATYACYDEPDLFAELVDAYDRLCMRQTEMALDARVESILTGGSGSITMQSPELWRKFSLPTLKKISKMCREAGVLCGVHSCGKEMALLEDVARETDVRYVNPLEVPPMGDCNLSVCKAWFGDKLALMGNLHTTNVMLKGSVSDVRREALKAICDAGVGGGFVLSTGDQCGYATPDENIVELVRVAEQFGRYPLELDRIESELKKLG